MGHGRHLLTLPSTSAMEDQLDKATNSWLNPHRLRHINDLSDTVSKKRYTADDNIKCACCLLIPPSRMQACSLGNSMAMSNAG